MEGRNTDEVTDDSATRAIRLPRGPLSQPGGPPAAEDGDGSETIQVLRPRPRPASHDDTGPADTGSTDTESSDTGPSDAGSADTGSAGAESGSPDDLDDDRTLPGRPLPVRTVPDAADGAGGDGGEADEDVTATQVWALTDVQKLVDKASKTTQDTTPDTAPGHVSDGPSGGAPDGASDGASDAAADTAAGVTAGTRTEAPADPTPDAPADPTIDSPADAAADAPADVAGEEDDATYTRPIPRIAVREKPAAPGELPSSPPKTPTLSVVIVTGEVAAWHNLRVTLASLRAQQAPPEQIIVVVDHCPELAELARSALDGVVVLHNEGHRGVAAARNLGLSTATGDVVAFHDDETAAEPDWSAALLAAFADRQVLAVRSNLTLRWVSGRPTWFPEELTWLMGDSCTGSPDEGEPLSDLYGAGLAFRREALTEVGGFPEDLDHQAGHVLAEPPGGVKAELWHRLRGLHPNGKVLYEPSANVRSGISARRATRAYVLARCVAEGRSLAAVPQRDRGRRELSTHLAQVKASLPRTAFHAITLTGPNNVKPWQALLTRLMAMVATLFGYLSGRLDSTRTDHIPQASNLTWFVARTALPVSTILWGLSLRSVNLDEMTDLGLLTVLPATFWVAIALMVIGFVALLGDRHALELWHAGYVLILIAVLHATPSLLYPTLRYSWAWKHVSVIDYLIRHGATDPGTGPLSAYHQWPGFFSFFALMTEAAGLDNAIDIAKWGPLAFNVATLLPLLLLFRTVTRDRQLIWGAIWVYFSCSWVGQDYFSPQATTLALYLIVLAVVVRRFRRGPIRAGDDPDGLAAEPPPMTSTYTRLTWTLLLVVPIAAIASSHQLTPLMLVSTLAFLFVLRRYRNFGILLLSTALAGGWAVIVAWSLLESKLNYIIESLGDARSNLNAGLVALGDVAPGQVIVAYADRALSGGLWLLAIAGAVLRRRWLRRPGLPLLMIGLSPLVFLAAGSYGGEIIFRVYLFTLPLTAFLAASVFLPNRRTWVRVTVLPLVLLLMVAGFFFGNYGKEQSNYFTLDEVRLVKQLHRIAPDNSLIVAPTFYLPGAYDDYDKFAQLWLDELPPSRTAVPNLPAYVPTLSEFVKQPTPSLISLMSKIPPGAKAYLVLNRAQRPATETAGILPKGTIDRLKREVESSGRFTLVLSSPGGVVYELQPARKK
ncbi:glycosyltransferase [Nonomuraea indica]|uniref:Glycosyltransferase n=1 Tax=Nonomuraea indica TaxID=1581193 RepID=A0ABW8A9K2_9ACTN